MVLKLSMLTESGGLLPNFAYSPTDEMCLSSPFEEILLLIILFDRLCGLVVRVLGYRSGGPGSIPGTTKEKKIVGLERSPLSLVSTTEELLDRNVAIHV
jgi:hypothetical protein